MEIKIGDDITRNDRKWKVVSGPHDFCMLDIGDHYINEKNATACIYKKTETHKSVHAVRDIFYDVGLKRKVFMVKEITEKDDLVTFGSLSIRSAFQMSLESKIILHKDSTTTFSFESYAGDTRSGTIEFDTMVIPINEGDNDVAMTFGSLIIKKDFRFEKTGTIWCKIGTITAREHSSNDRQVVNSDTIVYPLRKAEKMATPETIVPRKINRKRHYVEVTLIILGMSLVTALGRHFDKVRKDWNVKDAVQTEWLAENYVATVVCNNCGQENSVERQRGTDIGMWECSFCDRFHHTNERLANARSTK